MKMHLVSPPTIRENCGREKLMATHTLLCFRFADLGDSFPSPCTQALCYISPLAIWGSNIFF
ncbi:Uncharacterized protein APZ42_001474 [Daphnia magna]|uniref:Uncharacterized protein n=1 Tax=Daphnia magna TaxID=35525 RepID=A0A162D0G2_9CRUS|nr:Uncharacterized protein APZ42_001474 [Daphnia magna]